MTTRCASLNWIHTHRFLIVSVNFGISEAGDSRRTIEWNRVNAKCRTVIIHFGESSCRIHLVPRGICLLEYTHTHVHRHNGYMGGWRMRGWRWKSQNPFDSITKLKHRNHTRSILNITATATATNHLTTRPITKNHLSNELCYLPGATFDFMHHTIT